MDEDSPAPPPPPASLPPRTITEPQILALLHYVSLPAPASGVPPSLPSSPLSFLSTYISSLPPNLLLLFGSPITFPLERSSILPIRNRRLTFATSSPSLLSARRAKRRHPLLWERIVGAGSVPDGAEGSNDDDSSEDEEMWAQEKGVLGGQAKIGRFGALLKGFEEEREGERLRGRKKEERKKEEGEGEEFDSESDEEEDEADRDGPLLEGTVEERIESFERLVRERFLNGLEDVDYDPIDLSETWDPPPSGDLSQDNWFHDESPEAVGASLPAGEEDGGLGEGEYDY